MYERTGLGWSEISWWESAGMSCGGESSREVCFPDSEIATAQASGCVENRTRWTNNRMPCMTQSGNPGHVYCCRPGYPRAYEVSPEAQAIIQQQQQLPEILPSIPEFQPPTPGEQASFFARLMHPGALMAIGLFSIAGVLIHRYWRTRDEL